MPSVPQRSFAGGVLAPALHGRADVARYGISVKTLKNFYVRREGSAENRPGTELLETCSNVADPNRLVPFVYNPDTSASYFIEWAGGSFFLWSNGSRVVSAPTPWTTATAYTVGDAVSNGFQNWYCFTDHTSDAASEAGAGGDTALYWHPMFTDLLEIPHPYDAADLPDLRWSQSNDVLTLTHPSHPPYELRRFNASKFAFAPASFEPAVPAPTEVAGSSSGGTGKTYRYAVTAVSEAGEESLPGLTQAAGAATITNVTKSGNTVTITTSGAHSLAVGDRVFIKSIRGTTELNKKLWRVATVPSGTTFTIKVYQGSVLEVAGGTVNSPQVLGWSAYVSGGTVIKAESKLVNVGDVGSNSITISWTAAEGAVQYRVYREVAGIFGFIGASSSLSFVDTGFTPDVADPAPEPRQPFVGDDNQPACVGYFQQRRVFGATNNAPQSIFASAAASGGNFTFRLPAQPTDAVIFALQGRQVERVRHILDMDRMVILTAGAVYTAEGDANGTLTPTDINLRQRSVSGASTLQPIQIDQAALYVQARASIVRDLVIDSATGFVSRDLTIFSSHLFEGREVVDWAYQQVPNSIVWCVLDDGTLMSLTYVRDHDVWGWAEHETEGTVESICVVPEGNEDAVYLQTLRPQLYGGTRAIERMASRDFDDIADALFLDCATLTDGTNDTATTVTISGGTDWTHSEALTLTASASTFGLGWVGEEVHVTIGDEKLRLRVVGYTSGTIVTVNANRTVPVAFRNVATTAWGHARFTVTGDGLWSTDVGILADGNPATGTTDGSGSVTLTDAAVKVWVGLPYTCDLELLDVEDPQSGTLVDKKKRVNGVTVLVQDSRGMFAGPDEDRLWEWPQRVGADGETVPLFTGKVHIPAAGRWGDDSSVLIRQTYPLPLRVLGVVRHLIAN